MTASTQADPRIASSKLPREFSPYGAGALLFVLTLLAFSRTITNGFVSMDDAPYITDNPIVRQGLTRFGIEMSLTSTMGTGYWHPLTMLSLMLDASIWGMNPAGFHATAITLHAVNAVLVFLWLYRWTGYAWRAWVVAALFALHPLRVESVAWAAERKDLLFSLFGLLSILAYGWFTERRTVFRYGCVMIAYALSLMSKPMLVTLPVLLLAADYWPLRRWSNSPYFGVGEQGEMNRRPEQFHVSRLILEKVPLALLGGVGSLLAIWGQSRDHALATGREIDLPLRMSNIPVSYVRYIGQHLNIWKLSPYYPFPDDWSVIVVILCSVTILIVLSMSFRFRERYPWIAVGVTWYFIGMLPVIGLLQVGSQAMADRFTYLPGIGILLAVVWCWSEAAILRTLSRRFTLTVTAIALLTLTAATWVQCGYWKDDRTFFERSIISTTDPAKPVYYLVYLRNNYIRTGQFERAREVLRLLDDRPDKSIWFAQWYFQVGETERATKLLETGLRDEPKYADLMSDYGLLLASQGHLDDAMRWLKRSMELKPESYRTKNNIGYTLVRAGRPEEAIEWFVAAIEQDRFKLDARCNLGATYLQLQNPRAAYDVAKAILQIDPWNSAGHFIAAKALTSLGDATAAAEHIDAVKRLGIEKGSVDSPSGVMP